MLATVTTWTVGVAVGLRVPEPVLSAAKAVTHKFANKHALASLVKAENQNDDMNGLMIISRTVLM